MLDPILLTILVTAGSLAIGIVVVLGHGALLSRRRTRRHRVLDPARLLLLERLGDPFDPEAAAQAIRTLRGHERAELIVDLTPVIEGDSRVRLAEVAARLGLTTAAIRACRSRRWPRRLAGARVLTVVGIDVPEIRALLSDPVGVVRAQAAEWASDHPSVEILDRLIDLLADPVPLARSSAHDALVRIGAPAAVRLVARIGDLPADHRAGALLLARTLPDPRFAEAAQWMAGDRDPIVRSRALSLLGALALPETEAVVLAHLQDDDGETRAAAARALAAVAPRTAVRRLPVLLQDAEYVVRRAAAEGLRVAGAAGRLLLRRASEISPDRFARDMAARILAMPEELMRQ